MTFSRVDLYPLFEFVKSIGYDSSSRMEGSCGYMSVDEMFLILPRTQIVGPCIAHLQGSKISPLWKHPQISFALWHADLLVLGAGQSDLSHGGRIALPNGLDALLFVMRIEVYSQWIFALISCLEAE
jgi:hypothetical protein